MVNHNFPSIPAALALCFLREDTLFGGAEADARDYKPFHGAWGFILGKWYTNGGDQRRPETKEMDLSK